MYSKLTSTTPVARADGSLSAVLLDRRPWYPNGQVVQLLLPSGPESDPCAGRFFMLRCSADTPEARGDDWNCYARRPLFVTGLPVVHSAQQGVRWELYAGAGDGREATWLRTVPIGSSVNLLGPFGRNYPVAEHIRALLVVAQPNTLPPLLPWVQIMLDRGGRVTLILHQSEGTPSAELPHLLLRLLPIPVEVHWASTAEDLQHQLAATLRWADQLVVGLPHQHLTGLAKLIAEHRFHFETGFALAYAPADLICGFGACLACVVTTSDGGHTRACLNGPVFPLEALVR